MMVTTEGSENLIAALAVNTEAATKTKTGIASDHRIEIGIEIGIGKTAKNVIVITTTSDLAKKTKIEDVDETAKRKRMSVTTMMTSTGPRAVVEKTAIASENETIEMIGKTAKTRRGPSTSRKQKTESAN